MQPCARAAASSRAATAAGRATATLPMRKVCRAGRAKSSGSSSGGSAPSRSCLRQYARCGPRCAGTSPERSAAGAVLGGATRAAGACCASRNAASWRAVGWSKTSVLGSAGAPSPSACCSWLRSSTAPSESSPASISGASASTAPPAVRAASASTVSSDTAAAGTLPPARRAPLPPPARAP